MSAPIVLSLREANLLRRRLHQVVGLRHALMAGKNSGTIHDLRVASRRLRELLDYLQFSLPPPTYQRLRKLTRTITKTLGRTRESEVNLAFIHEYAQLNLIDPAIIEVLIHSETRQLRQRSASVRKEMRRKGFEKYDAFLSRIKGSRTTVLSSSNLLAMRANDFLAFPWQSRMND